MRKIVPAASSLLILGLLLAACAPQAAAPAPPPKPAAPAPTVAPAAPPPAPKAAEQPRRGGVLTLAIASDPATLDPHTNTAAIVANTIMSSYSNLVQLDMEDRTQTRIIGDLATRWEASPDGTVYTFYLRKDAKFHDGQPVTAADVKFSLERIARPPKGQPSPWKEDLGAIKGIETPDNYTVKITLKFPSPSFLHFVAGGWMVIVPKHLLDREGNDVLKLKVLGSGPFMLKEYNRGVAYEAVRNPNYYKPGLPYLEGHKSFVIKDSAAYVSALRTGQVMVLRPASAAVAPAQYQVLRKEMGDRIVAEVSYGPGSVVLFTPNNKWKPFTDARVRRAVSLGLNRQGLFDIVYQGLGQVGGFFPTGGPWALPKAELETYPGYEPDMKARIAKAKELLADAGYPGGLEMTVSTRGDFWYFVAIMEYVVSELPKIGIKAKAVPMEAGAWYAQLERGDFQAAAGNFGVSSGDPDSIIGSYFVTGAGFNHAQVSDPRVDELYQQQRQTMDPQKRKEIVWETQRIVYKEAYRPAFGQQPRFLVMLKKVKGILETSGTAKDHNVKYEDIWLAE